MARHAIFFIRSNNLISNNVSLYADGIVFNVLYYSVQLYDYATLHFSFVLHFLKTKRKPISLQKRLFKRPFQLSNVVE